MCKRERKSGGLNDPIMRVHIPVQSSECLGIGNRHGMNGELRR